MHIRSAILKLICRQTDMAKLKGAFYRLFFAFASNNVRCTLKLHYKWDAATKRGGLSLCLTPASQHMYRARIHCIQTSLYSICNPTPTFILKTSSQFHHTSLNKHCSVIFISGGCVKSNNYSCPHLYAMIRRHTQYCIRVYISKRER
jgi:hypothetical protein